MTLSIKESRHSHMHQIPNLLVILMSSQTGNLLGETRIFQLSEDKTSNNGSSCYLMHEESISIMDIEDEE